MLGSVPTLWTLWGQTCFPHNHGVTGRGPSSDIRGALCPHVSAGSGVGPASMAPVLEDRWGWVYVQGCCPSLPVPPLAQLPCPWAVLLACPLLGSPQLAFSPLLTTGTGLAGASCEFSGR